GTAMASPPFACDTAVRAASRRSSERSTRTTDAPAAPNAIAVARPMSPAAPVTTATRPDRSTLIRVALRRGARAELMQQAGRIGDAPSFDDAAVGDAEDVDEVDVDIASRRRDAEEVALVCAS